MSKLTAALIASIFCVSAALAAEDQPQFSAAALRSHVAFLADDLLEGRETGSRGFDIGARYIASRFAELGLTPAGLNGDWYIPVQFQVRTVAEGASVTISGPTGSQRFMNGTDVILASSAVAQQQDVEAELVFVGYGIDEARIGINDYADLDVTGKFVVTLAGFPKGMDSEIGAHLGRVKSEVAASHGAAGLIVIDTDQSEEVRPWARRLRTLYSKQMTWIAPDGKPNVDAFEVVAGVTLGRAAADAVFAGAPMSVSELRAVAARTNGMPRALHCRQSCACSATVTGNNSLAPRLLQ